MDLREQPQHCPVKAVLLISFFSSQMLHSVIFLIHVVLKCSLLSVLHTSCAFSFGLTCCSLDLTAFLLTPCSARHDLSHSPLLWEFLPSESMPLPDTDWHHQAPAGLHRGERRCWCRWSRSSSRRAQCTAKEAPCALQRWTKQCTNRACKWTRGAVPPGPMDDFPGHAMALQVLPFCCHLCWDLVPVWSALVPSCNGAWRSAG